MRKWKRTVLKKWNKGHGKEEMMREKEMGREKKIWKKCSLGFWAAF